MIRGKERMKQIDKFMDTMLASHWDLGILADLLVKLKDDEK